MSFWTSSTGNPISGTEEAAFIGTFKIIPDNTKATAVIKEFEIKEFPGVLPVLQITWELLDGQFRTQHVRQKMAVWDTKPEKQDRAKNMLMLICKLTGYQPTHSGPPTENDLASMKGKICGIQIQEYTFINERGETMEGNWVSQVKSSSGFQPETGVKHAKVVTPSTLMDSALTRNSGTIDLTNDDIPF